MGFFALAYIVWHKGVNSYAGTGSWSLQNPPRPNQSLDKTELLL
jgi:hypothetical protein